MCERLIVCVRACRFVHTCLILYMCVSFVFCILHIFFISICVSQTFRTYLYISQVVSNVPNSG